MRLILLPVLLFFIIPPSLLSQDTARIFLPGKIVKGDTLPTVDLGGVVVFPPVRIENKREVARYDRLVYNIRIVYPYAKLAGIKLKQIRQAWIP